MIYQQLCLQNPVCFGSTHHSEAEQEHCISALCWSCSCVSQLISSHSASIIRPWNICHSCLRGGYPPLLLPDSNVLLTCEKISICLLTHQKPNFLIRGLNSLVTKKSKLCCSLGSTRLFRNQSLITTQDPKLNSQSIVQFHFSFY